MAGTKESLNIFMKIFYPGKVKQMKIDDKSEAMISTAEAAEILGTCSKTVLRYGECGTLVPYRRSKRYFLWKLCDVEKLATIGIGQPSEN